MSSRRHAAAARLFLHGDELATVSSMAGGSKEPFIAFHRPTIEDVDVRAVTDKLRSGWLTHGPECQRFEVELARAVAARRAVSVSSGTAALHLSLVGLEVENKEVITTTFTFCSTALAIEHAGATPVLVDIEPETMQIDCDAVENAISERTAAIVPVDFGGHPCDIDRVNEIAKANGLSVVTDAAHSLGAAVRGAPVGSRSTATCFSFYATKNITTGEGGMVTTNDDGLADRIEMLRLHGLSRDAWRRHGRGGSWKYEVLASGFKANLTDPQAALGLAQLSREPQMRARRTAIAGRYTDAFLELAELTPPVVAEWAQPAWHLYPLRLNLEALSIDRDEFIGHLDQRGIGTSVHFIPVHMHPYFRKQYEYTRGAFARAEDAFTRVISLPIYPTMTDADVTKVITSVVDVVGASRR